MMQAMGVAVIFMGMSGALKELLIIEEGALRANGSMLLILSLALGTFVGEWINVEARMESAGRKLKKRFASGGDEHFVEGFVNTSLVVCVGAMAILGALEDGINGNPSVLYAKAVLDAVFLLVLAAVYGKGALFSAIPVGLWQGSITLFAEACAPLLTDRVISDVSAVGNTLLFCLGINLIFGNRIRIGNMLPGIVAAALYHCVCM